MKGLISWFVRHLDYNLAGGAGGGGGLLVVG